MTFKEINNCRCCNSDELKKVLDLKQQPLANSYHTGEPLEEYPLAINVCTKCFHTQLTVAVNPDQMFSNYLYLSGISSTLHEYFEWFASMVESENKKGKVLDIACNDGTQLSKFKNRGWISHGIDPAKNLSKLSEQNCDFVVIDYLNKQSILKLPEKIYDVIIAQNVFAHTNDVYDFLSCCKELMDDNTNIYIQTSQADMIENNQFDTIYHEHLSFFSTLSMNTLCQRAGLYLNNIKRVNVHGGSYVFRISKTKNEDNTVNNSLSLETKNRRYDIKKYDEYKDTVNTTINSVKQKIDEYKQMGYLIIGYGAAAKGNTFLNAASLKLHYIIDDNNLKYGLLTPGSNTFITSIDIIDTLSNNTIFVPLAWNFYDEIVKKLKHQLDRLKFKYLYKYEVISFFPTLRIENL